MDVALAQRQLFAGRDPNLLLHDVQAGDQFGHRMFDLDPRVHLDEIELALFVQELEGARAAVADLLAGVGAARADALDQAPGDAGRRSFLEDLLVAALHRAVALAQVDRILVLVGQDLDFDMARVLEELLHVDRRVAEGCAGLGAGHGDRAVQRRLGMHHPHAAATAAAGGLDDHRITHRPGNLHDFLGIVGQCALGARHDRHARFAHGVLGRHLVAHQADRVGARADEDESALFDPLGEVRILGQEAVARMDRL